MPTFQSLTSLYDSANIECLNEDIKYPISNALNQPNLDLELRSLDDEQLLIRIPFQAPVKIAAISIKCSPDAIQSGAAPKKVKLFTNDPQLDFNSASDNSPKQTLEFGEGQLTSGEEVQLRFVNFQNVRHLTIFIDSNQADKDVTRLGYLQLYGCPESNLDMKQWKATSQEGAE